ncbi:MAG: hypothetical protein QOE70_4350 [Chthoniobacter sp.]|jgi:hypothetical protein|nr:hypothetical protein [Chthoniobacter sp.]
MSDLVPRYVVAMDRKGQPRSYLAAKNGSRTIESGQALVFVRRDEAQELAQRNDGAVIEWLLPREEAAV